MRKLSAEKIGSLLSLVHAREKQMVAATLLLPSASTTTLGTAAVHQKKGDSIEGTGCGLISRTRTPNNKLVLSKEEKWSIFPQIEEQMRSLCRFKRKARKDQNKPSPSWEHDIGSALEGKNLSQMNFECADLSNSFIRSDLRWANFDGCMLKACLFDYAEARAASMCGVEARDCTFVGADFEGADFSGATFFNCKFLRCNLKGVIAPSAIFFECDFTMSEMSDMKLSHSTKFEHPTGWSASRRLNWQVQGRRDFVARLDDQWFAPSAGGGGVAAEVQVRLRDGVPHAALQSLPAAKQFDPSSQQ